jgi:hypothetical protein
MAIATMPLVERVARTLAALELSDNADGSFGSAAPDVDHGWQDYADRAIAVLKAMREPDEAMAAAGDPVIWTRMIAAALGKVPPEGDESPDRDESYVAPEPGTDPMHEGP